MGRDPAVLIESDRLKVKLLEVLSDQRFHTPSELASRFRTNSVTISRNAAFLAQLGLLTLETRHTRRKVSYIRISDAGISALKALKEGRWR
jgi:DNA-binding MarR family transcriptional regulator